MKYPYPLLALGAALFLDVHAASAQQYSNAYSRNTNPPPSSSPAAGASATPAAKQPLTATLAKDDKGKTPTTAFTSTDAQVFLLWKDATAAKGDTVRVVWVAEAVEGVTKNKKISEGSQTLPSAGSYNSSFFLNASKGGFPAGKYRVELYDGAKLAKNLKFTVTK